MASESWHGTGLGEVQKVREQMASQFKPEFFLRDDGSSAKIVVLDKEPFNIYVHQVELRGKFKKYTCMKGSCPLCKVNEARFLCVYRIIDTSSYEGKDGKVHKNVEKYYEIGSKVMAQVESLEEEGLWYGKVVKVKRIGKGTKTSYALTPAGDSEKRYKPSLKPLEDYKPKSFAELETLAQLLGYKPEEDAPVGGGASASRYYEENDEEELPPVIKKKKPAAEPEEEEDEAPPAKKPGKFASKKKVVEPKPEDEDDDTEDPGEDDEDAED